MANEENRWGSSRRPFPDWARWEQEMGKKFDEFLERGRKWWPPNFGAASGPPVDIYEETDEMVARVELPGMDKSDVEVEVSGRTLTIKGEKKRRAEIKDKDYYRSETAYGAFVRIVELPHEPEADRARATLEKGVLELRFPKTVPTRKTSTKIDIS